VSFSLTACHADCPALRDSTAPCTDTALATHGSHGSASAAWPVIKTIKKQKTTTRNAPSQFRFMLHPSSESFKSQKQIIHEYVSKSDFKGASPKEESREWLQRNREKLQIEKLLVTNSPLSQAAV
jgi:hypothetical protein